ncbi:hypothetical protein RintRC_4635 [Richelia intracellularis]|nr:hypothetical protein RintRC_4635 [Richelia intracellularis]
MIKLWDDVILFENIVNDGAMFGIGSTSINFIEIDHTIFLPAPQVNSKNCTGVSKPEIIFTVSTGIM